MHAYSCHDRKHCISSVQCLRPAAENSAVSGLMVLWAIWKGEKHILRQREIVVRRRHMLFTYKHIYPFRNMLVGYLRIWNLAIPEYHWIQRVKWRLQCRYINYDSVIPYSAVCIPRWFFGLVEQSHLMASASPDGATAAIKACLGWLAASQLH